MSSDTQLQELLYRIADDPASVTLEELALASEVERLRQENTALREALSGLVDCVEYENVPYAESAIARAHALLEGKANGEH